MTLSSFLIGCLYAAQKVMIWGGAVVLVLMLASILRAVIGWVWPK